MGRLISILSIATVVFNASCYKAPVEKLKLVKSFEVSFEDTSVFKGYFEVDRKNLTNHVTKITSSAPFGGGIFFDLPDSLLNKNLRFIIKAKTRSDGWNTFGHSFVINMNDHGNLVNWYELNIDNFFNKRDEWNNFEDSIHVSRDRNHGSQIKIFGYDRSKKDFMEYDDLRVEIKVFE